MDVYGLGKYMLNDGAGSIVATVVSAAVDAVGISGEEIVPCGYNVLSILWVLFLLPLVSGEFLLPLVSERTT